MHKLKYDALSSVIGRCTVSGFTLLEVLVSLTLLIIVLGAVYSTFFSVHRAIERFNGISLKYHEARTTLDLMRREIESALLKMKETENSPRPETSFIIMDRDDKGKSTSSLDLTAYSFKGTGLNIVSYYAETDNDELNLLKKERPALVDTEGYTMEMIDNIESFTVETLFNDKWVKTWDTANTGQLPDIVRISIEFSDNGKSVRLTEYARPKVGKQL